MKIKTGVFCFGVIAIFVLAGVLGAQHDTTPPALTVLSVSENTVDASAGPVDVVVNYTATDDLSGLREFSICYASPGYMAGTGNQEICGSAAIAAAQLERIGDSDIPALRAGWGLVSGARASVRHGGQRVPSLASGTECIRRDQDRGAIGGTWWEHSTRRVFWNVSERVYGPR